MTTATLAILLVPGVFQLPQPEELVILGTGVICREEPTSSAARVGNLRFAGIVWVESDVEPENPSSEWHFVRSPYLRAPCWVHGSLTAPFDGNLPEEAVLAVVEHVLATSEGRPLEDFVQTHNLFVQSWIGYQRYEFNADESPVLSLRRLELLSEAFSGLKRSRIDSDPLSRAWVLSHGPLLRYFEPGGEWEVQRSAYWALFERFRGSDAEEDLAWAAARQPASADCEGQGECYLRRITRSVSQYWERYPNGEFIEEALKMAVGYAGVVNRCEEPDWSIRFPGELISEIRESLSEVDPSVKAEMLRILVHAEAKCLIRSP